VTLLEAAKRWAKEQKNDASCSIAHDSEAEDVLLAAIAETEARQKACSADHEGYRQTRWCQFCRECGADLRGDR